MNQSLIATSQRFASGNSVYPNLLSRLGGKHIKTFLSVILILSSFAMFVFAKSPAADSTEIDIGLITTDRPYLVGSQCDFSDGRGTVLVSDWVEKVWIKINGNLEEFTLDGKLLDPKPWEHWKGVFISTGITAILDLHVISTGAVDTAAMKGTVTVRRGKVKKVLTLKGGCGA